MASDEDADPVTLFRSHVEEHMDVGAGCFAVTVLAIGVLLVLEDVELTSDAALNLLGWTVINAHFVEASWQGLGPNAGVTFDLTTEPIQWTTLPASLYHLVPMTVLLGGGVVAARRADAEAGVLGSIALGATTTLGYAIGTGICLFVLTELDGLPETFTGSMVTPIVVIGVGFPLVFGGLGGLLEHEL